MYVCLYRRGDLYRCYRECCMCVLQVLQNRVLYFHRNCFQYNFAGKFLGLGCTGIYCSGVTFVSDDNLSDFKSRPQISPDSMLQNPYIMVL